MLPDAAGAIPPLALETRGDIMGLDGAAIDLLLAFYGIANPHPQPAAPAHVSLKRFLLCRHLGIRV
jgi:hypothetical protein